MAVARKEIRESLYWLRLADPELMQGAEIASLIREANELSAILTSSIKTAKARSGKSSKIPAAHHAANRLWHVEPELNSRGRAFHWHPVRRR